MPTGTPLECVITNKCVATPKKSLLVLGVRDQIQWRAAPPDSSYTLKLPGGYFAGQGHEVDFELEITGIRPLPETPLVAIKKGSIKPYIYDTGTVCQLSDEPPEIIIGS